ncbi:hypothetical protein F5Y00DRAFT_257172 [Daldinia vernicosa]|uniref:uncharacterized protein n=1 Tax=Daldinia vernicosa TaxID=114800 RepID=UPI002007C9A4|nr:uncharacterized protein F5Y00DRAFT_257172 [Daldinia vernicosa]KAI0853872.1 hypothetical protein F5Y00DRAFT_257172 [Daldinia vernicosa]
MKFSQFAGMMPMCFLACFGSVHSVPVADNPSCLLYTTTTELDGDGSPHDTFRHQQLTEVISCGSGECEVGKEESTSYSVGFTLAADAPPGLEWISGGFEVSKTWTSGTTYSCTGQPGDKVCVWYNAAYTSYSVREVQHGRCGGTIRSDPFVMNSPKTNNNGGGFYCVFGDSCRSKNDEYWE